MDIMVIVGSVVGLGVAIIGFFLKREISSLDAKIGDFNKKLDKISDILTVHDRKITINAEKDGADYRVIESELQRIKKEMDKDIVNITVLMNTKLAAVQATLERILNKLDGH